MATANAAATSRNAPAQRPVGRPQPRGPVTVLIAVLIGFVASVLTSLVIGVIIEVIGDHTWWKGKAVEHAQAQVIEDLGYIELFPKSILVPDTVAFANNMVRLASKPWDMLNAPAFFEHTRRNAAQTVPTRAIQRILQRLLVEIARVLEILLYVTQGTAVRLSVAFFALPAFAMACLMGLVDGLVKRDLRKWSGGRESSFVYHHSKHYTAWFLTAGFSLYLAWPIGGFNPAWMVLTFAVLVAMSLSVTVASFKKYL
jgi:integrating conjugative element membrane protein (TIGR03747 family)